MFIECCRTCRSEAEHESIEHCVMSVAAILREGFVAIVAAMSPAAKITESQDIGECLEQRARLGNRAAAGVTPKISKAHREREHRKSERRCRHAHHRQLGYHRIKRSRLSVAWSEKRRRAQTCRQYKHQGNGERLQE